MDLYGVTILSNQANEPSIHATSAATSDYDNKICATTYGCIIIEITIFCFNSPSQSSANVHS